MSGGLVPARPHSRVSLGVVTSLAWQRVSPRMEICVPGNSGADPYQNVRLSPAADFNKHCEEFMSSRGILHAYQWPDDEPAVLKEYKM